VIVKEGAGESVTGPMAKRGIKRFMKKKIPLSFTVNGEEVELYISPNRTLLEVLREELELTGTKEGCGEGVCGSCTVLCDGVPVRSCLTLAMEVDRHDITTVEGLGEQGEPDPLQQSFIDHGAVQCRQGTAEEKSGTGRGRNSPGDKWKYMQVHRLHKDC